MHWYNLPRGAAHGVPGRTGQKEIQLPQKETNVSQGWEAEVLFNLEKFDLTSVHGGSNREVGSGRAGQRLS